MLPEISREGALAGRAFSLTLLASAIGLIALSWDDIWRVCGAVHGDCVERSAGAVILALGSIPAIAWGIGILVRIRRRPVDPAGSSRYVWALGVLFALGWIFIAGRIPAFTCDRGHFDDALAVCMHPPSISEATSWLLLKEAIVVIGLLGALRGVGSAAARQADGTRERRGMGDRVRLADRRHHGVIGISARTSNTSERIDGARDAAIQQLLAARPGTTAAAPNTRAADRLSSHPGARAARRAGRCRRAEV